MPVVKRKAFAYITYGSSLLVFSHPRSPEAGIQVPAGTMRDDETPEEAVLREALEETGLRDLAIVDRLGEHLKDRSDVGLDEVHHRFFFHLRCDEEPPERWHHYETDASDVVDGKPIFPLFELFWAPLPDGVPQLIADHDYFLWKLTAPTQSADVAEQNARMRAAYDATVPAFTRRTSEFPEVYVEMATRLLSITPEAGPLLDLGCGPGHHMAWWEDRGTHVLGADLSAGMLAEARARTRGPLVQVDMRSLSLRSGSIGGVWCSASLLHIPKEQAGGVCSEMRRVLSAGGAAFVSLQLGSNEQWEPSRDGPVDRFFARYSPAEATTLLADHGFEIVEMRVDESEDRRGWIYILARPREGA